MAIRAITPWTVFPFGISSNVSGMVIQNTIKPSDHLYAWKLDVVAGNPANVWGLVRAKSGATGNWNTTTLALSAVWIQGYVRFDDFPTDEEFLTVLDNSNALNCTFRIRTDGKIRFHGFNAVSSGTATATADNALSAATWYRIRIALNYTGQTMELLVYNEAGTLVASASASSVNFNSVTFGRIVLGWSYQFTADGGGWQGSATSDFTWYYGNFWVDDAAYVSANERLGVQYALANGTANSGVVTKDGTGNLFDMVNNMDGATTYVRCVTANGTYSTTLQTCASCTPPIAGTINYIQPGFSPWDLGVNVGSWGIIYESGVLTATGTTVNRGSTIDQHFASPGLTLMPSGAALSVATLDAMQVGWVRNATTNEIRVGTHANVVSFTPDAPSVTSGSASSVTAVAATLAGNVTSDGGSPVTERGIAYGTSANPTTSGSKVVVSGTTGSFTGDVSSLSPSTTYHYRAYATNAIGTTYGDDATFTTLSAGNPPHQQRGATTPRFRGSLAVR